MQSPCSSSYLNVCLRQCCNGYDRDIEWHMLAHTVRDLGGAGNTAHEHVDQVDVRRPARGPAARRGGHGRPWPLPWPCVRMHSENSSEPDSVVPVRMRERAACACSRHAWPRPVGR